MCGPTTSTFILVDVCRLCHRGSTRTLVPRVVGNSMGGPSRRSQSLTKGTAAASDIENTLQAEQMQLQTRIDEVEQDWRPSHAEGVGKHKDLEYFDPAMADRSSERGPTCTSQQWVSRFGIDNPSRNLGRSSPDPICDGSISDPSPTDAQHTFQREKSLHSTKFQLGPLRLSSSEAVSEREIGSSLTLKLPSIIKPAEAGRFSPRSYGRIQSRSNPPERTLLMTEGMNPNSVPCCHNHACPYHRSAGACRRKVQGPLRLGGTDPDAVSEERRKRMPPSPETEWIYEHTGGNLIDHVPSHVKLS